MGSGGAKVGEDGRGDTFGLAYSHVEFARPVEAFVGRGRAVAVREIAPPAAFDPAGDDGSRGPFAEDVPNSLAEAMQELLVAAAHAALGKNHDAFASIESGHRLLQLRR